MKYVITVMAFLTLTGCAHQTTFEKCNHDYEWQRYGSMDACMSEKKAEDSKPGILRRMIMGFNQGYQNSMQNSHIGENRSISCVTTNNLTTCN